MYFEGELKTKKVVKRFNPSLTKTLMMLFLPVLHYRALTECLILVTVFQMMLTTHVAPQVRVSLKAGTRMQAKQPNASLINMHGLNSH